MDPRVGIGVLIKKDGKYLFGKRIGEHGKGTWAPPGGQLEFKESFEACARREVLEETGIEIQNIRFAALTNDIFPQKHYITIILLADWKSGVPKVREPQKCEKWSWFFWNRLPRPLFLPEKNLLASKFQPPQD